MSYKYENMKDYIYSDQGQRDLLKCRDKVKNLLMTAGAFRADRAYVGGTSWEMIANLDRLVELGEIKELKRDCWTQHIIYTAIDDHQA